MYVYTRVPHVVLGSWTLSLCLLSRSSPSHCRLRGYRMKC
jgi:hypothetical protein